MSKAMKIGWSAASRRLAVGALIAALALLGARGVARAGADVPTGALPPTEPLRFASVDLRRAPGLAAGKTEDASRPSWRTSFGSEIRNEKKRNVPKLAIDADVVLLQGLTSMREVRRLFPARDWKLIVSRQMLVSEDPLDPWSRDAVAGIPTTAIAVRFQRDVRVTGQDHLMELAAGKSKAAAGTAVRLSLQGKALWVVSVALPADCAASTSTCAAHGVLENWRQTHRAGGEETIVGGVVSGAIATDPCGQQTILSDRPDAMIPAAPAKTEPHALAGCLSRLDLVR